MTTDYEENNQEKRSNLLLCGCFTNKTVCTIRK